MDEGQGQSQRNRNSAEIESAEGESTPSLVCEEEGSCQYDVFLSFKGLDTRKTFTDHLYHGLIGKQVNVFRDDDSIPIGEEIDSQIFNTITRSKIAILIISKKFASNEWCLRELVHIMRCQKSKSLKLKVEVMPIFYGVDPSDVQYLQENFGDAFPSSRDDFVMEDVKLALQEVSDLKAWVSQNAADGYEGKLVELVVKDVLRKLGKDFQQDVENFQLDVPEQLIGLNNHLEEIMGWIHNPSGNARMLGIYGMGGIGKTTLAKYIYNQLLKEIECASFLGDIREKVCRLGIEHLQGKLISDLQQEQLQVSTVDDGLNKIKSIVEKKKVLILLDDIDHKDQLDNLARKHDWFMAGSVIIVTTRRIDVLERSEFQGCCWNYELTAMGKVQSLLLFNRHAFRSDHCPSDFDEISRDIVSTLDGLPLALKVIGAYLYEKQLEIWKETREQLKEEPHAEVQDKLKISFDALQEGEKEIFLDIACFFIGENRKYAMYMWEDCKFYPNKSLDELKLRCLITIENDDTLKMHDQLRDLGRSIVHKGQWSVQGSRLWDQEASKVLKEGKFHNHGYFEDLPDDWDEWSSIMSTKRLKVLELSRMDFRNTPDFSAFPDLEILILDHSVQLKQLHPSVGTLKCLVFLDLSDCDKLRELPEELGGLQELKQLILCRTDIEKFPTSIGYLRKLENLDATTCIALREIPPSIGRLSSLQRLKLDNCRSLREIPASIGDLRNLQLLEIGGGRIKEFPGVVGTLKKLQRLCLHVNKGTKSLLEIGDLSSLQHLDLVGIVNVGSETGLPSGLSHLIHLEELVLSGYELLENIRELPSRLQRLSLSGNLNVQVLELDRLRHLVELSIKCCDSIGICDLSGLNCLKRLYFTELGLCEIQGLDDLESLEEIIIIWCCCIQTLSLPKFLKIFTAAECQGLLEIRGLDKAEFLEKLDIPGCQLIERLPDLSCFATLKELDIYGCDSLHDVDILERFLYCRKIYIGYCESLKKLPNLSKFEYLKTFTIIGSPRVTEIPGIGESRSLTEIIIARCQSLKTLPDLSGCENLQKLIVAECEKLTRIQGLPRSILALKIYECYSLELPEELPKTSRINKHKEEYNDKFFHDDDKIVLR